MQEFAGPAKAGGAGPGRLGELVEAILLDVGSVEELVHPPDALLELLARELVEADRGCLRSAHVLDWGFVDGPDGAEGPADLSSLGASIDDTAWLGRGGRESVGGVVLHLRSFQAAPGDGQRLGQVQHLLAPVLELGSGFSDVGGVDIGADGDAEALHRGAQRVGWLRPCCGGRGFGDSSRLA